jgi:nitrogen regulatory protein P-II 2
MPPMSEPAVKPLPSGARARLVAIVRPVRVDAVMEALHALAGVAPRDVLIEQVRGYGRQKTHLDFYEEGPCEGGFLPKVRLQFTVDAGQLEPAVAALRSGARTGRIGDGKVFVHVVESA